jgi:hypothetical protein
MIHSEKIALLERTHRIADEFARLVPPALVKEKPSEIAFSVNEIVHHLVDVEKLWHSRFEQIISADHPKYEAIDPDALAKEHKYNEKAINDGLSEWALLRAKTIEMIKSMDEAIHHRTAMHSRYGELNTSRMLDIMANHDLQHLEQMKRTISQVTGK